MPSKKISKKIFDWFMRNILLPNNEIIDVPGYIAIQQFSKETGKFYLREVFLPEGMMTDMESAFIRKYRGKGEDAIYRAGKEWGYWFCMGSGLPKKSSMPKQVFLVFMYAFIKLLEAEYTREAEAVVDYEADTLTVKADGLMMCSKNGHGQFLLGTITGAWAYLTGRDDVDGAHPECQGRKDAKCVLVCGPAAKIRKFRHMMNVKIRGEMEVDSGYVQLNMVKKLPYAKNSLKSLLESGYICYHGGFFHINDRRLILNEASFVYFLEKSLGKLPGGAALLFDTSRKYFAALGTDGGMTTQMISDVLPALGWGDLSFQDNGVFVHAYPYSKHYGHTTFPIMRGMLSGLLSGKGREVRFRKVRPLIAENELQLDIRS